MSSATLPLTGLTVVDFTNTFPGALSTMTLADYGAEVIKVEPPSGDPTRDSPGHHMWNRGKASMVLDLTDKSEARLARDLCKTADVVVTDWARTQAEGFELDYRRISAANPRVVYCSIGDLERSSELGRPALATEAAVASATGLWMGLDQLSGAQAANCVDGRPLYKVAPVNGYAAAQLATIGILAALLERSTSHRGQELETSLLLGACSMLMREDLARAEATLVPNPPLADLLHRAIALTFLTVQCADGEWIQMCARQDSHFRNWMIALDLEDVMNEPRFKDAPLGLASLSDITDLEDLIRGRMKRQPRDYWMNIFTNRFDVGADPFLGPVDFLEHDQIIANNRSILLGGPAGLRSQQLGPLVDFEGESLPLRPGSALGADTSTILTRLASPPGPAPGSAAKPAAGASAHQRVGPLSGFVILEVAYFLAAPLAGTILAELGARVIKIEPLEGDPFRRTGKQFAHLMHGKESLALNLKTKEGQKILADLAAKADGLVHNFRPGVPERIGLDVKTLRAQNPDLVYLYAASYGSKGPQSHRAAFHSTPNALCGAGMAQGGSGNPPVDDSWPDPAAGLAAAVGLLLGLCSRERTGKVPVAETSMLVSAGHVFSESLVLYQDRPAPPTLDADQLGCGPFHRFYQCADTWSLLEVRTLEEWRRLVSGLPGHALEESMFSSAGSQEDERVVAALTSIFATESAEHWEATLRKIGITMVPTPEHRFPEYLHKSGLLTPTSHPEFDSYWSMPPKVAFSRSASSVGQPAGVGEHTTAILTELGYGDEAIDMLKREGVVHSP